MEQQLEVWQVFSRQLRAARNRRGWSLAQLARRIEERGFAEPGRARLHQIEAGGLEGANEDSRQRAENVRLREVIACAYALGVAPTNLMCPIKSKEPSFVRFGNMLLPPYAFRGWFRGAHAVGNDLSDWGFYYLDFAPTGQKERIKAKAAEYRGSMETGIPVDVYLARLKPTELEALIYKTEEDEDNG